MFKFMLVVVKGSFKTLYRTLGEGTYFKEDLLLDLLLLNPSA